MKLDRATISALDALQSLDRDDPGFYELAVSLASSTATRFAIACEVRIQTQPWSPYGATTGLEITDLYADAPGRGGGTRVMELIAEMADTAGLSVYLRPSSARNRVFYARFGFEQSRREFGFLVRHAKLEFDKDDEPLPHRRRAIELDKPEYASAIARAMEALEELGEVTARSIRKPRVRYA